MVSYLWHYFSPEPTWQSRARLNISLDITERVKAENILVQRTHELQQSNDSLEEFAYVASHDLKEPLRKISIFTNRLAPLKTFPETEKIILIKLLMLRCACSK